MTIVYSRYLLVLIRKLARRLTSFLSFFWLRISGDGRGLFVGRWTKTVGIATGFKSYFSGDPSSSALRSRS